MTKRKVCMVILTAVVACSFAGCKADVKEVKDEKDYFIEGYDLIDAGEYEKALLSFEIAADQGDKQAETAAEIITVYLDAKAAFEKEDFDKAKEILNTVPDNYKYYAIGKDIDELRYMVYKGPEAEEEIIEEELFPEEEYKTTNKLSQKKALEYLKAAYPEVEGDLSEALDVQYDADGQVYYMLSIQIGEDIKTLHIFPDGEIKEVE